MHPSTEKNQTGATIVAMTRLTVDRRKVVSLSIRFQIRRPIAALSATFSMIKMLKAHALASLKRALRQTASEGCVFGSRRGHQFRKHQFQGVRMKLVLKSCCSIQPTWTILALLSCLTCREHGVRETTISVVVLE